jgi:hypothetical protein
MKKIAALVVVLAVLAAAGYGVYQFLGRPATVAGPSSAAGPQPTPNAPASAAGPASSAAIDTAPSQPALLESRELDADRTALVTLLAGAPAGSTVAPGQMPDLLSGMLDRLDGVLAKLPRESFDVDAVRSAVGTDPQALFAWVRDQTSWVPYRGTLRGATGVLMDRFGNSLDRALLLSALLSSAGRPARLAHATLSREQAAEIARLARRIPAETAGEPGGLRATLPDDAVVEFARVMNIDAGAARVTLNGLEASAVRRLSAARAAVRQQSAALVAAVGEPAAAADEIAAAAMDHWWVVTDLDGQPLALDPTLPDAKPGVSFAPPRETIDPSRVPESQWHTVRVNVVTEHVNGTKSREAVVLSRTLRPSELFGQHIVLTHLPAAWKPDPEIARQPGARDVIAQALLAERKWRVRLTVGPQVFDGSIVRTSGDPEKPRSSGGVADAGSAGLWGGLAGGEGDGGIGELTAEWIEFEIRVPGKAPTKIRRAVLDLLGPAARQTPAPAGVVLNDSTRLVRALALSGETVILPLVCRLSPEYVSWLHIRAAMANRELLLAVARGADLPDAEWKRLASSAQPAPNVLHQLALARHAWNDRGQDVFLAEPNILAFHNTFRADASGGVVAVEGLDIVANAVAVHASAGAGAFPARVQQGVADSFAEDHVLLAAGAATLAADAAPPSGWVTVRAPDQTAALPVTADVKARIGQQLRERVVLVVPRAGSSPDPRWWRVDPATGGTLRVGDLGWGQIFTEKSIMEARQGLQMASWGACTAKTLWGSEKFGAKEFAMFAVCQAGSALGLFSIRLSALVFQTYCAIAKDVVTVVAGNAILIFM